MLVVTVVAVGSRSCLPLGRTSPLLRDSWVYLSLITYLSYLLSSRGDSMGILRMTGEGGSGVPVKRVRRAQQGFTLLVKLLVMGAHGLFFFMIKGVGDREPLLNRSSAQQILQGKKKPNLRNGMTYIYVRPIGAELSFFS